MNDNKFEFNNLNDEINFDTIVNIHYSNKEKALNRRKNTIKHKRRLIYILNKYGHSFNYPNRDNTYIMHSKNSKRQQHLKTQTHRRNRRKGIDEEECGQKGNHYRRAVDYKWELD